MGKMAKKMFAKGMSPIISTILLIAFAVSIGVTIMKFGGIYYENLRAKDISCSNVLINAFKLKDEWLCRDYEYNPILNFYSADKLVRPPECYSEIVTGDGRICAASNTLLNFTWAPTRNIIR